MFPKRLCLSTKQHYVSSHNTEILLLNDMRTALIILISCSDVCFLCKYVPAYIGMYYPCVCMYVCLYVCLYVIYVCMYVCVCV